MTEVSEPAFEQSLRLFEDYHTLAVRCKCLPANSIYTLVHLTIVKVVLLVNYTGRFSNISGIYYGSFRSRPKYKLR